MSDLLKIITLFKYGGTALNLDITVTKSLSKLGKHWFVKDGGSIFPMLNLSNDLIGYKIYDAKIFRPIGYEQRQLYLETDYVQSNFGYQTWLDAVRILPRDSLYCTIARDFCPFIYGEFMEGIIQDY
ncbi:hypothetical protein KGM_209402 [Danaus plexippus plexippus]|uniref:Uncharacterized protein n=1 Tax=Danaus plexippus plexippus TaxID=278856 RepID=A0A212FDM3_DANPL|nr:hypothetical protein KGM_209402 [Danaus plexippus plexippus]